MALCGQLLVFDGIMVHIWPMLKTVGELTVELGARIRMRRALMGLTQAEAAGRAGVAYRTWRRLECEGAASLEDLVKASLALRCEGGLEDLFPRPAASSLDELIQRQAQGRRTGPIRARPA